MKKTTNTVNVMGVEIARFNHQDLFDFIKNGLVGSNKIMIAKCPSEFIKRANENIEFNEVLEKSGLSIADGVGVLWASKYLSLPASKNKFIRTFQAILQMVLTGASLVFRPSSARAVLPERLSGAEAFGTMMSAAEEAKKGVYFFGSRKAILEGAVKKIKETYPQLILSGYHDGYSYKDAEIIEEINSSEAELLIVALGSPKQEYWIRDNFNKLATVKVAVGEGGTFDAISGAVKRAPKLIQKIGLEWLWRMFAAKNLTIEAPKRYKRIWNAVPVFIYDVVKWKIKNG